MDLLSVVIETPRLRILPNTDERYAKDMFRELTPEVAEFLSFYPPKTIDDSLSFIRKSRAEIENGTDMAVVILDKETGEFMGCSGIHGINSRKPDLGIWLKRSIHGKGYGKEVIQSQIDWVNKNMDYEYIGYPVAKANIASRKLIESLGGVAAEEKMRIFPTGKSFEGIEYRIYKKQ